MEDSFAKTMSDRLIALRDSNDIEFLKKELVKTEKSLPECAAESLYRTNKLNIIQSRINELLRS